MPTSVISRSTSARCSGGYTLLEMVVVLAIMALVMGIAAVRVFSMIESWRVRTQLDDIDQQFQHLPVLARQRGETIVLPPPDVAGSRGHRRLSSGSAEGLHLPPDWLVHFDRRLVVTGAGFCRGARIVLQKGVHTYPRIVTAPFCRLQLVGGAP